METPPWSSSNEVGGNTPGFQNRLGSEGNEEIVTPFYHVPVSSTRANTDSPAMLRHHQEPSSPLISPNDRVSHSPTPGTLFYMEANTNILVTLLEMRGAHFSPQTREILSRHLEEISLEINLGQDADQGSTISSSSSNDSSPRMIVFESPQDIRRERSPRRQRFDR